MVAGSPILQTLSLATGLRMVRVCLSFIITCFLARHLGGVGFGELAVAMAAVSILLSVGELGFSRYTVRELMREGSDQAAVLGTTITARLLVSALLFAGLLMWVAWRSPAGAELLLVYGLQLLTNPSTELLAWLEAHGKVPHTVLMHFAGFLISSLCMALGIWAEAPLWFYALTYALEGWVFLLLSAWLFRRQGGRINFRAFRFARALALVGRSWPELASQAALLLLFRLDTMMIEWLRGAGEAGVYGAAVRVSEMAYFVPSVLATLFLPRLMASRLQGPAEYERQVVDYLSTSVVLALLVSAGLLIVSPFMSIAFGPEFERSSQMLRVHGWAFIPYAVGIARTQILIVEDRLLENLPSVLLALAINAWLNLEWIPAYGGVGAAWSTLVSYTVAWLVLTYLSPGLRQHVSRFMTRALVGLPRFTVLRVRALLDS